MAKQRITIRCPKCNGRFGLLTAEMIAERLGVSRGAVWQMVRDGRVPEPKYRHGQRLRLWHEADVRKLKPTGKGQT